MLMSLTVYLKKTGAKQYILLLFISFLFSLSVAATQQSNQWESRLKQADSLIQHGQLDIAERNVQHLLVQGKKDRDSILLGKAGVLLGNIYLSKRQFDQALAAYLGALTQLDSLVYWRERSKMFANIGTIHAMLKNFEEAEANYLKSLALNKEENTYKLQVLINLSGLYNEMGKRKEGDLANQQALVLARKMKRSDLEAVIYTNLSNSAIHDQKWVVAEDYARESLKIRSSLHQPASAITLNNLGYALVNRNRINEGIGYYKTALPFANLQERKQLLLNLEQAYASQGKAEKALSYFRQYDQVKDSIAKQEYERKVAELAKAYEAAEQQQRIKQLDIENELQSQQLTHQRYLIWAIALFILFTLLVIFLWFKNYQVKSALAQTRMKQRLLSLQLNPHFIFNALQSIQQFIYKREEEQSMLYLHRFSRLIRLVLENSDRDWVSLQDEIDLLANYLELQQLNSQPSFTYTIQRDEQIDADELKIPTLLLQPFVENAVIHGIKGLSDGKIDLHFRLEGAILWIIIQDNGKGFNLEDKQNRRLHRSMGMHVIKQRIAAFNKTNQGKISLEILTGSINLSQGTLVKIGIAKTDHS